MNDASWIIRERATGAVICETFDRRKVDALRLDRFEAVPIGDYLASLNYRTELTPAGEQAVIPGCERNFAPGKRQLDLFG
jgi:hypothetical protein